MSVELVKITELDGSYKLFPFSGYLDREDLEYIFRDRHIYAEIGKSDYPVGYEIQVSYGGENYFSVDEYGVSTPLS